MKKTVMILPVLLVMLLVPALGLSAEAKIGYANLQRALNDCKAGIEFLDAFETESKKLKAEVDGWQEEIKKLSEEIEKKGVVWNKETREAKEKAFKDKRTEFQQKYSEYSERLMKEKEQKEQEIIDELRKIVKEIAKKRGFTVVFEKSFGTIIYATDENDITEDVIKLHNERFGSK